MSEVFVVSEGAYSDYRIVAIYDTLAAAEEFVTSSEDRSIATWELNTPQGQVGRSGYELMAYPKKKDQWGQPSMEWKIVARGYTWWDATQKSVTVDVDNGYREIRVLGDDREHAQKLIQDAVAEVQARDAGLT